MRIRAILLLALIGVSAVSSAAAANQAAESSASAELHAWANAERAGRGLPALRRDGRLDSLARSWARHLASTGGIGHRPDANSRTFALGYRAAGENVGVIGGDGRVAFEFHSGWMGSPGHRTNILQPGFDAAGYGVACGTYRGVPAMYAVANFGGDGEGMSNSAPPSAPRSARGSGTPVARCTSTSAGAPAARSLAAPATPRPAGRAVAATPSAEPTPAPTPTPSPAPTAPPTLPTPEATEQAGASSRESWTGPLVAGGAIVVNAIVVVAASSPRRLGARRPPR